TAIPKSSLQTAVYANSDRELWVAYATLKEGGSADKYAYESEYNHIPFKHYLTVLKPTADGGVEARKYSGATPDLWVRRDGLSASGEVYRDGMQLMPGDVIEARHASDGLLADRLVIR